MLYVKLYKKNFKKTQNLDFFRFFFKAFFQT